VGAVVTGAHFVELARLHFCVGVAFGACCWAFVVFYLFERRKGKCFVELARLIILFRVGLGSLFVVFGLSRFPVGLLPFFVRAVVTER